MGEIGGSVTGYLGAVLTGKENVSCIVAQGFNGALHCYQLKPKFEGGTEKVW